MTQRNILMPEFNSNAFGKQFLWGVSASAFQTEGGYNEEGKGVSNWDVFSGKKNKIKGNENATVACDFYNRYHEDISIIGKLNIPNFRFSLSWSRIFPEGTGQPNKKGIDFYNKVIDTCLEQQITPWITLYHWDLPQTLEEKGGWCNREIVNWFSDYVHACVRLFKDRVKHWMVLNEPMVFTGAGYFLGVHAPGKKGLRHFLPALHHAVICQATGIKIIKQEDSGAQAGSTFSCSYITPNSTGENDLNAARKIDTLLNRLFIEPALGLGYPVKDLPLLKKLEKYMLPGDEEKIKADFDFVGLQNYTREVAAYSFLIPYIGARLIPAHKRKVYHTAMDWEVYPEAIYEMIKKFSAYEGIKKIIITENGAAFPDKTENGKVHDQERIRFLSDYLEQVLKAKNEGLNIHGYFVWSLTDNFEWAEGYQPRFGLVHIDFNTLKRTIKDSGKWYQNFLIMK